MLLDVPLGRFGFTKTASLLKVYFLCRGLLTVVNLALAVLSFGSQLHSFWRCKYHIVWTPKFRFKILKGNVAKELNRSIYILCNMKDCEVLELNVQPDHVHLVAIIPPQVSISTLMGVLKGRSTIRLFNKFPHIRKKLWGNHFWARGYFVDTVGVNEEIIRRYVRHQCKKKA
ncbi:IS1004 transposase [Vibrio cholerae]|nr:IS1004 transposase [Vibrio cholerae]